MKNNRRENLAWLENTEHLLPFQSQPATQGNGKVLRSFFRDCEVLRYISVIPCQQADPAAKRCISEDYLFLSLFLRYFYVYIQS